MEKPTIPVDETGRLMSLHSLRILDTGSEERFDRITRMAKRLFDVDICLVSLVDSDRQWFKSKQGLTACETPRDISFCGHAILSDAPLIVADAAEDPRFADNPLVAGEPHIRFYAGCPIHGPDGYRIGTLCIVDALPRTLSIDDRAALSDLVSLVEDELATTSRVHVDELTQIANRRGFNTVAGHLLSLCRRTGLNAELVFFDLDGFKQLNDTFGHKAWDKALQQFARLLIKCFRTADVVARLGGDEFVVMMAASKDSADVAMQRLDVMASDVNFEVFRNLAWSVGRINFDPERHDSVESLLADADRRMYEHKIERRKTGT